jgi:hypothetical protein
MLPCPFLPASGLRLSPVGSGHSVNHAPPSSPDLFGDHAPVPRPGYRPGTGPPALLCAAGLCYRVGMWCEGSRPVVAIPRDGYFTAWVRNESQDDDLTAERMARSFRVIRAMERPEASGRCEMV